VSLLDVNLLVSLFDPDHIHHDMAHDWFADHQPDGWATCATTELGFVRVLAHPRYGAELTRPVELVSRLRKLCASKHHVFWDESVSLLDGSLFDVSVVAGHRQLTDIYLLGLATKRKGRLATFDRTIPLAAVIGATRQALAIVEPAGE
jgi:toxin-antitoxin system PIN domain toxin